MKPEIVILAEKKLIGKSLKMSLTNNRTAELWKSVMPHVPKISGKITNDKISLQCYDPSYFTKFNPNREFEKWAAVEVASGSPVPEGFKKFRIPSGKYAVFHYKGHPNNPQIFQYIYADWLPQSPFRLVNRPHFEILGENYRNDDSNSEETIWIPIEEK